MKQKRRKQTQSISGEKVATMPRRPSLFWDVDPKTVDPQKHARYIIERILDFGEPKEIRWLFTRYSRKHMRNVMNLPRGVVNEKSKALWSLLLR